MNDLRDALNQVEEFHTAFKVMNKYKPTTIPLSDYVLRHTLMNEENTEYLQACSEGNLVEIADALGDQLYILCGTILKHGLQDKIKEVFNEIHQSNMSKLDANGHPILRADGKVLKSDLYFRPNIKGVLNQ